MLLGNGWARWRNGRDPIRVDGAIVRSATVVILEIAKHVPHLDDLGLVLRFPRLHPAHLTYERVFAFVAASEILFLPCPGDASFELDFSLVTIARVGLAAKANRKATALSNFGIVRLRAAVAIRCMLPLSK